MRDRTTRAASSSRSKVVNTSNISVMATLQVRPVGERSPFAPGRAGKRLRARVYSRGRASPSCGRRDARPGAPAKHRGASSKTEPVPGADAETRARGIGASPPQGPLYFEVDVDMCFFAVFMFLLTCVWYVFICSGVRTLESASSRSFMIVCIEAFIFALSPAASVFASAIFLYDSIMADSNWGDCSSVSFSVIFHLASASLAISSGDFALADFVEAGLAAASVPAP